MKKILLAPMLLVASPACLAPTEDLTTHEHLLEASAPLVATSHALALEAAPTRRELPAWNVYLLGPDLHKSDNGQRVYDDYPKDSDLDARVIAVRAGDERKPEKWIHLYLEMYRYQGNAYFEKMIAEGKLTLLDLLVIDSEIETYKAKGAEPPLISTISSPAAPGKVQRESEQPNGPSPGWGN